MVMLFEQFMICMFRKESAILIVGRIVMSRKIISILREHQEPMQQSLGEHWELKGQISWQWFCRKASRCSHLKVKSCFQRYTLCFTYAPTLEECSACGIRWRANLCKVVFGASEGRSELHYTFLVICSCIGLVVNTFGRSMSTYKQI